LIIATDLGGDLDQPGDGVLSAERVAPRNWGSALRYFRNGESPAATFCNVSGA
jgi:hypothetical protein